MSDVRPLPVWPWPMTDAIASTLRVAKASLDVSWLIAPCPAVPGSPGRVLAFGEVPPFACEAVLVRPEDQHDPARLAAALTFLMSATPDAPGLVTQEKWLSAVMGMDVRFLYEVTEGETPEWGA